MEEVTIRRPGRCSFMACDTTRSCARVQSHYRGVLSYFEGISFAGIPSGN